MQDCNKSECGILFDYYTFHFNEQIIFKISNYIQKIDLSLTGFSPQIDGGVESRIND